MKNCVVFYLFIFKKLLLKVYIVCVLCVGLQYVKEYQYTDISMDAYFMCELCRERVKLQDITAHVKSPKHNLWYMVSHCTHQVTQTQHLVYGEQTGLLVLILYRNLNNIDHQTLEIHETEEVIIIQQMFKGK